MQGGIPLQGKVRIQGSKNAVLPILAATLLTNEVSYIQNCPRIADVHCFVHLLRELGCLVHWQEKGIRVQPGENEELPCERAEARRMQGEAITGMRSSLCLLGALLGRCGYVTMEHPGGCIIGERPIDLHIRALQQMGVEFREEEGLLSAQVKDGKMHGAEITLEFPSVGATENILLAAVKADGDTRILGAAREPEVTALCEFLTACGAQIEGIGGSELLVHGDRPLHSTRYTVPSDRIVAGTYLFAPVLTTAIEKDISNGCQDALTAMIDIRTGVVITDAVDQNNFIDYHTHPVTGVPFPGLQLPFWEETIDMMRRAVPLASKISNIGWDVTMTAGGPLIIEANTIPGFNTAQYRGYAWVTDGYGYQPLFDELNGRPFVNNDHYARVLLKLD